MIGIVVASGSKHDDQRIKRPSRAPYNANSLKLATSASIAFEESSLTIIIFCTTDCISSTSEIMNDSTEDQPNGNASLVTVKERTDLNIREAELGRAVTAVFLKHVVTEVVEETTQLRAYIDAQKNLVDSFDSIQLRFGDMNIGAEVSPERFFLISLMQRYVSIAKALDGSAASYNSENVHIINTAFHNAFETQKGSFLECPLHDCAPIPLSRMRHGILVICNQTAGVFSRDSALHSVVGVMRLDHGKPCFELCLFPHDSNDSVHNVDYCLKGNIDLLSETDQSLLEEDGTALIQRYLNSGEGLQSPNVMFVPTAFCLTLTPETELRYSLAKRIFPIQKCLHDASNDFRSDIIKSIGSNVDMTMLEKNSTLKDQRNACGDIRKLMETVEIEHDDKTTALNLRDGQLVSEYGENDSFSIALGDAKYVAWVIYLTDGIAFNERYSLKLRVSGVRMGATDKSWVSSLPEWNFVRFGDDGRALGFYSEGTTYNKYDPYAMINCSVHPGNDTEEEHYVIREIAFRLTGIKKTLDVLGIDYS